MRAIENGFSLVRPTYNGITFASDFNGNILATMDFDKKETGIMYADVQQNELKLYILISGMYSVGFVYLGYWG
jgi:apolipoprotein N-acyltransferase